MTDDKLNTIEVRQGRIREVLQEIIRGEVLPRVFETNTPPNENRDFDTSHLPTETVQRFQQLVLEQDVPACLELVHQLEASGFSLRSLCLGLFTDTAREFGERWLRDELGFAEVTIGLGTLHIIVHQLAAVDKTIDPSGNRHHILLASPPGEQHLLGILIVSKVFEMEGWLVTGGPDLRTGTELKEIVGKTWFDIIGLTASTEERAMALKPEILDLRSASLNQSVQVLVGGNGFSNHPGISRDIGADDLADDAEDAIIKATMLLDALEQATRQEASG